MILFLSCCTIIFFERMFYGLLFFFYCFFAVARRFPWSESAEQHRVLYDRLARAPRPAAR